MKESKLTPFDAETILMIKSVTGHEPEITEKAELFEMRMYVDDKNEYIIEAAINAVIGRYGMRVRAVPVTRDNIERLIDFTGGGTMEIPRKPGGIGLYSFLTENGVIMSVPERWAVIRFPDGRFGKMEYREFVETFEEKDENKPVLSFNEKRLFAKMNSLFGKDLQQRFSKLTEEYHELFVVADDMLVNGIMPDDMTEIIDELADMNAVLFHIAALFGYSQKELLEMAYNKIAGREKNPDFMRKHPHKKHESPVCGNCNNFENEDAEGDGFCNEQNRMRHCSCIACNQWQGKQTAEEYKQFEKRFNAIQ